ncbi:MAG: tripartite tricarboxylate transporter TctB family protein [Propionicimonas sp.]
MTAADRTATPPGSALRQNLLIGALSVLLAAIVIPYGASMPYIREGIPGPGLFPMMIGALLVLFGVLLPLTSWLGARGERRHRSETGAPASEPSGAAPPAVADSAEHVPAEAVETSGVLDTDVGSDGARRWINGAILMGVIVGYVLLAPVLGFPITMTLLVTAIVRSLRAGWVTAVITGVLAALGLWGLFEQVLLVQLPDGLIRGF